MAKPWDKMDETQTPDIETITAYVANPLWDGFLAYMQETYGTEPVIAYSGCGMAPGWNVKYKKAGKGLCTLYPEQNRFTALVVIGQKEKAETELSLPIFSRYTQDLYNNTTEGMGQRWLMFHVTSAEILEDVKLCITIRRKMK